jgi:hypothetical protein
MKAVKRWRYYCDFCKKANNSAFHMKNHESSCTLNPARVCKLCQKIGDGKQADMAAMLALLPDPAQFMVTTPAHREHDGWEYYDVPECTALDDEALRLVLGDAMKALRELTNGCPVCILAALRQKKIPVPVVEDFDFKSELSDMWADINQNEAEYA